MNIRERIKQNVVDIAPELPQSQQDMLVELILKEVDKAVSMAEWEASCGAYDQIMFSMKHGK